MRGGDEPTLMFWYGDGVGCGAYGAGEVELDGYD